MANKENNLNPFHIEFIQKQKVFFVATAPTEGFINLSPKGMDSFRVIDNQTIVWLNLTGSGNETAAHLLENPRMTIMMTAFEGDPLILRLYGKAVAFHPRDQEWEDYIHLFPEMPGSRQIIELKLEKVMTSCGFAVPIMEFKKERSQLIDWSNKKGEEGILEYQKNKNVLSLNGKPTGLFEV
ncbi:MAG: pyridoxamine 5'-phosphate oxidase family protein [Flavobacteriales bacterium]|nr:pyridoxamine 5'-phosphate oxidase family protein [Flavobacteriales bacterium]